MTSADDFQYEWQYNWSKRSVCPSLCLAMIYYEILLTTSKNLCLWGNFVTRTGHEIAWNAPQRFLDSGPLLFSVFFPGRLLSRSRIALRLLQFDFPHLHSAHQVFVLFSPTAARTRGWHVVDIPLASSSGAALKSGIHISAIRLHVLPPSFFPIS